MMMSRIVPGCCNLCRRKLPQCFVLPSGVRPSSRTFSSVSNPLHNPDFRPRRIILIRHGQSMGNVDESAYVNTADWRIPLTDIGKKQANEAGKLLREKICEKDAYVVFYHSPYLRTKQTLDEIIPFFHEREIISCLEEPRICEQQIGNFQNVQHNKY
mmetsp:Transcript_17243/g.37228  ORF Transcript_17243/g.37228 Transcript_17243/m.37228 type:complete len:157 (+) Transcript_17243:855-1325(+)